MWQPVGLMPEQIAIAAFSVLKTLNVMNPGSNIPTKKHKILMIIIIDDKICHGRSTYILWLSIDVATIWKILAQDVLPYLLA